MQIAKIIEADVHVVSIHQPLRLCCLLLEGKGGAVTISQQKYLYRATYHLAC